MTRFIENPRIRGLSHVNAGQVLTHLNRILMVAVIVVGIVAVWGLWSRGTSFTPNDADGEKFLDGVATDVAPDLQRRVQSIRQKTLFKEGAPEDDGPVEDRVQRQTLQDLAATLRLVGILAGDEPVVLIHDKTAEKTYTLRVGEYLDALYIQEITSGSVILMYEDETMELKL